MSDCALCERPILDTAYACTTCGNRVGKHLADSAELYHELAVQVARQARYGDRVRLSAAEPPLPFNPDAAADVATIDNTLTTWARHVANERGHTAPASGQNLMHWLSQQVDWLRYRPEAAEALDELDYAATLVVRCIDAPAVHWFAGPCDTDGCTSDLYGRPGGKTIRCRDCRAEYDADERRRWLMGVAEDRLGTAVEVARFCSAMRQEAVTTAMIRGYAFRGRLAVHGAVHSPLYRVGDVLAMLS